MVIDINGPKCRCGRQGCLEALAAGPAIAARARAILIKTPEPGYLMRLTGGDPKKITGEMVAKAAADGDPAAIRVMEETGRFIAAGCANIINLFDPQKVILGGGVMEGGELLLASVRRALKETRLTSAFKADDIVPAALGNQAGLAGAAALFGQR
jgi:predicted NBD/HSP70 family sugar kinase